MLPGIKWNRQIAEHIGNVKILNKSTGHMLLATCIYKVFYEGVYF